MTATARRSHSRSSSFIVLACILVLGVESRSSSFSDKRSVGPFVRRDANATTISNSSSSTTAPSTSATVSSSTQSSNITSTPNFSNTSTPTSSFGANSTSSRILSTSTSLILRTSTLVVTSTSTESSSSSNPIPLVDPTPSATFLLTGDILPTSSSTDSYVSPTFSSVSVASSNSSSSFLRNKAATVAVFLVVALIACGVIVIFIIAFFKRRARRGQQLHNQLFDHRKSDPATSSTHSPGDSISSVPIDAFSTREVGNESPLFFPVSVTQPPQPSSYIPLSLPTTTNSGPPVAFHNRAKRESAQPSIDSFYGAPARQSTDYKIYAL